MNFRYMVVMLLTFSYSDVIGQAVEKYKTETQITRIIIYSIIAIVTILYFKKESRNKSKMGINLKRVICPVCKTKQPIIRIPESPNQFLFGGTICPNCKTELDKYGNIMK